MVDDNTHVWIPGRGQGKDLEYTSKLVEQKMGVKPSQIVDLKALMGDASDNIPGIKGVGGKTAAKLLQKYQTLENLYQAVDKVLLLEKMDGLLKGALLKKLDEGRDSAFLSQQLARIDQKAPIQVDLPSCKVEGYDKTKATDLFLSLDFKSLLPSLPSDQFETDVQRALF